MIDVIELNGVKTTTTDAPTNHVYLVDVSGSMYSALPKMREHLKNVVSLITKPNDTFSIIYFSGRGQCGVVCENVVVRDVSQMSMLHTAIDRWLVTIGLTGFIEPLQLAKDVAGRIDNGYQNNFVMLTDGYDNCWQRSEIIAVAATLPETFDSINFIEFGWYCDRALITKLAEATGGVHLFSDGYTEYETTFESAITNVARVPSIEVAVNKKAKHAVYVKGDEIIITEPKDGVIRVPETTERVFSVVPKDVLSKQISEERLYMVLYYAAKTNDSVLVWNCLERLGDVRLVDKYNQSFSKQELTDFVALTKEAALNPEVRFADGKDTSYVPAKDAYTLLGLLHDLAEEECYLYTQLFEYNRTGRKKTETDGLQFIKDGSVRRKITGIVFHASRANVSIQTVEEGIVKVPENEFGLTEVNTTRTKNYTIIRDGIVNVKELPVVVNSGFVSHLEAQGVDVERIFDEDGMCLARINLSSVPVINRSMIEVTSLDNFVNVVTELQQNAAKQKVAKHLNPVQRTSKVASQYGEDAAQWLSSLGIRDYGFSPKVTSEESTDFYIANELKYQIKGLSSLPSINAVEKKKASGKKLTLGETLINKYLEHGKVNAEEVIARQRDLNRTMSAFVYSIIVGRTWFKGHEDRSLQVPVSLEGFDTTLKIDLVETEVKI